MRYNRAGFVMKAKEPGAINHQEIHEATKSAYKKALAKNGGDTYHAKKEAQMAAIDAGASPSTANHHAAMAADACGGSMYA